MSTTEANATTNANAASPFPPKLANTTNYFPPNNKAEIVKGAALLRDKAYQPNPVRVKAGGTVTWTNLDTVVHTITYGKGITDPAMGTKFDSGMLGGSFSQRFFKPGAYQYFCQIHPTMVGAVIVK
jgi:plastocyanin